MERKSIAAAMASTMLPATAGKAQAEMFAAQVKRIDKNFYKIGQGVYTQVRHRHRYASGDEAALKYERCDYDNKLIFDDGEVCDVAKVFE